MQQISRSDYPEWCVSHRLDIGVELLSRFVNWQDRTTCVLFSDVAGAVVGHRLDHPLSGQPAHCLQRRNSRKFSHKI
ncbi:MAG: hypothetical protein ACOYNY_01630 [Caldilineaceae bacterium]